MSEAWPYGSRRPSRPRADGERPRADGERPRADGERPCADGERARDTILHAAAAQATVDGLEGLSIGNLAAALGISKSGLYAHFGSKQELQLAVVAGAGRGFCGGRVPPTPGGPRGPGPPTPGCQGVFA